METFPRFGGGRFFLFSGRMSLSTYAKVDSLRSDFKKRINMKQAFILGAGLGTRLRPLTNHLPKPLVPLFHQSLAEWAMKACQNVGIQKFVINTHHLPQAWVELGESCDSSPIGVGANGEPELKRKWHGADVSLFHEAHLLETGGGLKNIETWIGTDATLVHNGDIFSTMPLQKLIDAHQFSGNVVTLALRSTGGDKRIAFDGERILDIRSELHGIAGTHVFSGIYCVNAEFLKLLPPDEKISVIPAFLELVKQQRIGAVVLDEGVWLDLGDRESYLKAHRELALAEPIHVTAQIATNAVIENSVIGAGVIIGEGAEIIDSVLWENARVAAGAKLSGVIVCSEAEISGEHRNHDWR